MALLVKLTQHGLGINSEWHLLDLYWFEQLGCLLYSLLCVGLLTLLLSLVCSLLLLFRGSSSGSRCAHLSNLFLFLGSALVLHTKSSVLDELGCGGLLAPGRLFDFLGSHGEGLVEGVEWVLRGRMCGIVVLMIFSCLLVMK